MCDMKILLYLNGKVCKSLSELQGVLTNGLYMDGVIFFDLLDLGKSGDLEVWMMQNSEERLANEIRSLDKELEDYEYIKRLSFIICGTDVLKASFYNYFEILSIEGVQTFFGVCVYLTLKKRKYVDEKFELEILYGNSCKKKLLDTIKEEIGGVIKLSEIIVSDSDGSDVVLLSKDEQLAVIPHEKLNTDDSNFCISFNSIPVTFRKVIGGSFSFGGSDEEQGCDASEFERKARMKTNVKSFYMMETPVTQELWRSIMNENPSKFKGDLRPVTNVSYWDCHIFASKIKELFGVDLRLPTEIEWEYAARGAHGGKCKYSGLNVSGMSNEEAKLSSYAWFEKNSNGVTHDVKQKKPNQLGLFDMSGNVWEWCFTKYISISLDGEKKEEYINRGGCAKSTVKGCRLTRRYHSLSDHTSCYLGLRFILSSSPTSYYLWKGSILDRLKIALRENVKRIQQISLE